MQKYANLVELEKCCQTHISCKISFLYSRERARQKFAKICKNLENFANFANLGKKADQLGTLDPQLVCFLALLSLRPLSATSAPGT